MDNRYNITELREVIYMLIDQAKQEIEWRDKIEAIMGSQNTGVISDMLDELCNRSSLLFANALPHLANTREYIGGFRYNMAYNFIFARALGELKDIDVPYCLVSHTATREEFVDALVDWEERNS